MKRFNERDLLSMVRNPAICNDDCALFELYKQFEQGEGSSDHYRGWCFDLSFFKSTAPECQECTSTLLRPVELTAASWKLYRLSKNDMILQHHSGGMIKIHLHSYLWEYPVAKDYTFDTED
jgi:hypothetical protein